MLLILPWAAICACLKDIRLRYRCLDEWNRNIFGGRKDGDMWMTPVKASSESVPSWPHLHVDIANFNILNMLTIPKCDNAKRDAVASDRAKLSLGVRSVPIFLEAIIRAK